MTVIWPDFVTTRLIKSNGGSEIARDVLIEILKNSMIVKKIRDFSRKK